jgi:hypothetical protein
MGRACSTNGGEEEYIQYIGGKERREEPLGRTGYRWMDNIKMDLRAIRLGGMDWIDLAPGRGHWRTLVNTVMNLRVI